MESQWILPICQPLYWAHYVVFNKLSMCLLVAPFYRFDDWDLIEEVICSTHTGRKY